MEGIQAILAAVAWDVIWGYLISRTTWEIILASWLEVLFSSQWYEEQGKFV